MAILAQRYSCNSARQDIAKWFNRLRIRLNQFVPERLSTLVNRDLAKMEHAANAIELKNYSSFNMADNQTKGNSL